MSSAKSGLILFIGAVIVVGVVVLGKEEAKELTPSEPVEASTGIEKPPEPEPVPDPGSVGDLIEMDYQFVGEAGELDEEAIEGLCRSVPGVVSAKFDIPSKKILLSVIEKSFEVAKLKDTLSRPGMGWSIQPLSPE